MPHGALPLLAAILRRHGHAVRARDLNVEMFDDLLRPGPVTAAAEAVARSGPTGPHGADLLGRADDVVARLPAARRTMTDPERFYTPALLVEAKAVLTDACRILSGGRPGIEFGRYSYTTAGHQGFDEIEAAMDGDDGLLERYYQDVAVPSLLAARPDVIGLSVAFFSQIVPAFTLARALRRADDRVHLTMGGPVITWGQHLLRADPRFSRWIDSVLLGEADDTFPRLLEWLAGERPLDAVEDVLMFEGERVVPGPVSHRPVDLDSLPTPDFTLLPLHRYFAPSPVIPMSPSRGCYYNRCTFCNYSFIKLAPYRVRSAELVAQDLAIVQRDCGTNVFCLESDVMLPSDLGRLARAILDRQLDVRWHSVARFEKGIDAELFATLRSAGCVRLYMGLESANDRVLKAMRKGTTRAQLQRVIDLCRDAGISLEAGAFFGYPTEQQPEAADTYEFVHRNTDVISRIDAGVFRLLRGSPLAAAPHQHGISTVGDPEGQWYELAFEEHATVQASTPRQWLAKIGELYPESELVDVAEDILYTAVMGPGGFRRLWTGDVRTADERSA